MEILVIAVDLFAIWRFIRRQQARGQSNIESIGWTVAGVGFMLIAALAISPWLFWPLALWLIVAGLYEPKSNVSAADDKAANEKAAKVAHEIAAIQRLGAPSTGTSTSPSSPPRLPHPRPSAPKTSFPAAPAVASGDSYDGLCPEPCASVAIRFDYHDGDGMPSSRTVDVTALGSNYFGGYCRRRCAERTFRFDRVSWPAHDADSGAALRTPAALRKRLRGDSRQAPVRSEIEVLFTGFDRLRKAELESIAAGHGMVVRKGVTQGLEFLCAGPNAGQSKVRNAQAIGAQIISEVEFLTLLDTGEVPR